MDLELIIVITSVFLFSLAIPVTVFVIREFVRDGRDQVAERLVKQFPPLRNCHSFVFARAKYLANDADQPIEGNNPRTIARAMLTRANNLRLFGYAFPIATYVMVSFAGFDTAVALRVLGSADSNYHFNNYLIYGMHAAATIAPNAAPLDPSTPLGAAETKRMASSGAADKGASSTTKALTKDDVERYGRGTIAVSVAAFLGAHLWTLIYLARRVTNFDLTPFSFLRATIQICLACFVAIFLRHLSDALPQLVWPSNGAVAMPADPAAIGSWLLALAFMIGFYPALGLNYLQERFAFLRFKTRSASVDALSRELPLEMIDGIDSYIKFRLGEYEIEDVQNLALANPVQLFIETPYPLLKIIDWIGQAQLIMEIDTGKIAELRNLGVRTSLDYISMGNNRPAGLKVLQGILHPTHSDDSNNPMQAQLDTFQQKAHIMRLVEIIDLLRQPASEEQVDCHGAAGTRCCMLQEAA